MGVLLVILILIIIRAMYENTHYEIEYKNIEDERVNDSFKILFFADLHNTSYGKNNHKLLGDIGKFSPDLILVAGDAFVSKENEKNLVALDFIEKLSAKYKIVYTFGNHETKLRNGEKYKYTVDSLNRFKDNDNLLILNNNKALIDVNGNILDIRGYEAKLKFYKKIKGQKPGVIDIVDSVGELDEKHQNISFLLAHNPDFFDAYAEYGVDYVFSGHNHGGIVRMPFVGGVISTSYKPFPKYYGGEYVKNSTKMFVTRGLGSHTIRFRLFNLPQIHMFTFKKK